MKPSRCLTDPVDKLHWILLVCEMENYKNIGSSVVFDLKELMYSIHAAGHEDFSGTATCVLCKIGV